MGFPMSRRVAEDEIQSLQRVVCVWTIHVIHIHDGRRHLKRVFTEKLLLLISFFTMTATI